MTQENETSIAVRYKKNKRWVYAAVFLVVSVICVALSVRIGKQIGQYSDFTVFWMAGNNFVQGNPLYSHIGGATRYIYPPFAAWLFQLFSFFTLHQAATLFALLNFILFFLVIKYTYKVFNLLEPANHKLRLALFFAVALSFRYYWYHFYFIQMNITVYLLCLLGIFAHLRGKGTLAAFLFVLAAFIKVFPVFFLIWLVLRGNLKTILRIACFTLIFTSIPFLWRGMDRGEADITEYYTSFIQPFQKGRVEPQFQNYSLSSAIFNLTRPTENDPGNNYQVFDVSIRMANTIYKISFLLIFGMMVFLIAYKRFFKIPVSAYELSIIFLAMLLLCGITWEYHLVTFLFIFLALIVMDSRRLPKIAKGIRALLLIFSGISDIIGRDTVGSKAFHYAGGYGFLTALMLVLFFFFYWYDMAVLNRASLLRSKGS